MHDLYILQVYHPNIDLEGNVCLNILRYGIKTCVCVTGVTYCTCIYECWLIIIIIIMHMYIQCIYSSSMFELMCNVQYMHCMYSRCV